MYWPSLTHICCTLYSMLEKIWCHCPKFSWHVCRRISVVKLELQLKVSHTNNHHTDVAALQAALSWFHWQAKSGQRHGAIITEDVRAKTNTRWHRNLKIHLNKSNVRRVELASLNHGRNTGAHRCTFLGRVCVCFLFSPHCCFLLSTSATCCSGAQSTV